MIRQSSDEHKSFTVANVKWKYALLPVWFLSYTYRGKLYCYAMNGQTGKFGGSLPLDKKKLYLIASIPSVLIMLIWVLSVLGGLFL